MLCMGLWNIVSLINNKAVLLDFCLGLTLMSRVDLSNANVKGCQKAN